MKSDERHVCTCWGVCKEKFVRIEGKKIDQDEELFSFFSL
jgi:hypothetical protein